MTFRPSLKVSSINLCCKFYDGRQALEMCVLHLVVILMYTDGFEPRVTEGWQSFCLISKCTNNVRIHKKKANISVWKTCNADNCSDKSPSNGHMFSLLYLLLCLTSPYSFKILHSLFPLPHLSSTLSLHKFSLYM